MVWIISNKNLEKLENKFYRVKFNSYCFYSSFHEKNIKYNNLVWFNDGNPYLQNISLENQHYSQKALDLILKKYKKSFIKYLRGNFILINFSQNNFKIYSDYFGIKKYFIWQEGNQFIISNDLKIIADNIPLRISSVNIANYSLTYHFTGGTTAFKNVKHNMPSQILEYSDGVLIESYYWKPEELLDLDKKDIQIKHFVDNISLNIKSLTDTIGEKNISLSLTGGADTRNLLALFLKNNIKPHLYTYGNINSNDCQKALEISKNLGLQHCIHEISMNAEAFELYARKIINRSGGLASIHRAHRLMAIEKESKFGKFMFLGTMGGEFIRGVSEDNYIIPSLVYENWNNHNLKKEYLIKCLDKKNIDSNNIDINQLQKLTNNEPYLNGDITKRKLSALSFITAHLHDAQDINLYETVIKSVYTPFLDIDYLELLFSSQYSFNNKEEINNKILARIENPIFASKFLNDSYKSLLKFKYSGEHIPTEVLKNKYWAALKKVWRQKWTSKYPQNFSLSPWMQDFIAKNLKLCYDYDILKQTFDLNSILLSFQKDTHQSNEAYWLKYTNPIMMRFIIEELKN